MDSRRLVIVVSVILSLLSLVSCAPLERPLAAASPTPRVYLPTVTRAQRPSTAPTLTPSSTVSLSPTATHTAEPTSTATSVPSHNLSGVVFFDHNGSGLREEGEPGIQDVPVCIDSLDSSLCSTTDAEGRYSIANVPAGPQDVYLRSPTEDPATAFRYVNIWEGPVVIAAYELNGVRVPEQHLNDTEIQPIDDPVSITLVEDTVRHIALMQGFLTSPGLCAQDWPVGLWYDHDPRPGFALNWQGLTDPNQNPAGVPISWDNHDGTDFAVPVGVPLVAMAPGVVNFADAIDTWHGTVLHVTIDHLNRTFATGTGHHSVLLVQRDDPVQRGQIVALSGQSGTSWPHVHLNLHPYEGSIHPTRTMDPFGVLWSTDDIFESLSYWTVSNEIVCPRE